MRCAPAVQLSALLPAVHRPTPHSLRSRSLLAVTVCQPESAHGCNVRRRCTPPTLCGLTRASCTIVHGRMLVSVSPEVFTPQTQACSTRQERMPLLTCRSFTGVGGMTKTTVLSLWVSVRIRCLVGTLHYHMTAAFVTTSACPQVTRLLCLQDIASGMDHIHSLGVLHRHAAPPCLNQRGPCTMPCVMCLQLSRSHGKKQRSSKLAAESAWQAMC